MGWEWDRERGKRAGKGRGGRSDEQTDRFLKKVRRAGFTVLLRFCSTDQRTDGRRKRCLGDRGNERS